MELQGKIFNFLGDSITEGHGASGPEAVYPYRLQQLYGLKEARNYGIGGTRYARQNNPSQDPRWDLDFCSRIEEMDPVADGIVVLGGVNDFAHGDAPIGSFSDRTSDTFYGACHFIYTSLLEKYPDTVITVCTPLHCLTEQRPDRETTLLQYVNIIREVAAYYGLPLLDLFAFGGIQPKVPIIQQKFMPDGVHPNDAGYEWLARRVGNFLLSL